MGFLLQMRRSKCIPRWELSVQRPCSWVLQQLAIARFVWCREGACSQAIPEKEAHNITHPHGSEGKSEARAA